MQNRSWRKQTQSLEKPCFDKSLITDSPKQPTENEIICCFQVDFIWTKGLLYKVQNVQPTLPQKNLWIFYHVWNYSVMCTDICSPCIDMNNLPFEFRVQYSMCFPTNFRGSFATLGVYFKKLTIGYKCFNSLVLSTLGPCSRHAFTPGQFFPHL